MSRRVGVLSAVVGMFELFRPSVTRRLREAPLFETSFRTEYCNATTLQLATLAGDLDMKAQGRPPSIFFARLLNTRDYCCMNFSFQPEPIFHRREEDLSLVRISAQWAIASIADSNIMKHSSLCLETSGHPVAGFSKSKPTDLVVHD